MRSPVNHALIGAALLIAGGCSVAWAAADRSARVGPAADYPVAVGEPFTIGSTTWTPADQLNYDAVGLADIQQGLVGVSAAHKTLPLPSYVEVTSLASGRTILVRLVERGPMVNETLLALSPEAAGQLGLSVSGPVRVRRVNPPEIERAALRGGGQVPQRMDTPESLLKVLRRKLAQQSPLLPPQTTPPKMPESVPAMPGDVAEPAPVPAAPAPVTKSVQKSSVPPALPKRQPKPAPAAKDAVVVQVAAFSTAERAKSAAAKLGGQVTQAGRFWRLQLGPYADRGTAAAALGKAKAAGYSDARIQRVD